MYLLISHHICPFSWKAKAAGILVYESVFLFIQPQDHIICQNYISIQLYLELPCAEVLSSLTITQKRIIEKRNDVA